MERAPSLDVSKESSYKWVSSPGGDWATPGTSQSSQSMLMLKWSKKFFHSLNKHLPPYLFLLSEAILKSLGPHSLSSPLEI